MLSKTGSKGGAAPQQHAVANAYRTGAIEYFPTSGVVPDPLPGGTLDDILRFAHRNNLPVFRFRDFTEEQALLVYVTMEFMPLVVMPLGYLYVSAGFASEELWILNTFVDQELLNWAGTPKAELVIDGGDNPMRLMNQPGIPLMPFIPPYPYWPTTFWVSPNPYLRLLRGGRVPVDGSGWAGLLGVISNL